MGQSPPSSEYSGAPEDGLPFLQGTADFGTPTPTPQVYCGSPTKVARLGDILFSVRAPVGELNLADQVYGIGRWLCAIRPQNGWDRRFAWWALHEARQQLNFVSTGSTYEAVATEDVGNLSVEIVGDTAQRAIADYLDRETARIDALIAAKERLLGLLAEKRRALITRAVTRGLDPHAPLRDSGIPWLGQIPAHWEVVRLRFLLNRIEQGWSPQAENREPSHDEWGVLKLNAVSQGRFDDTATKALPADVDPLADLEVHKDDVLITRANTPSQVGDSCFVEATRPRLMLCDLIYRLGLLTDLIDGRFLVYYLTMPVGRGQIEADARGTSASMVKISQEHIKDWIVPMPRIDEQRRIVGAVAAETAKLDGVRTATERTIALLKERRSALIAAAVTGQINIEAAS
jgi:type I restriction enzyme S subunit